MKLLNLLALVGSLALLSPVALGKSFESNITKARSVYESDGMKCLICIGVVDLAAKAAVDRKEDLAHVLAQGCLKVFPAGPVRNLCEQIITDFAPDMIDLVISKHLPDQICGKLGLCDKCQIFPTDVLASKNPQDVSDRHLRARYASNVLNVQLKAFGFLETMESNRNKYRPPRLGDLDGDGFSWTHSLARGADWRGKDCNDVSGHSQPGLKEKGGVFFDKNCNGVYGKTQTIKGDSYEELYCGSYEDDRQLISFGDSALAGFSIPVEWLSFKNLTSVVHALTDELDWPMNSYSTGYESDNSFVSYLRRHNRCSHRQFQNVGMNGAVMADLSTQIDAAVISKDSKPVFATIAYIGNDICKPDLESMTDVESYRRSFEEGLEKLDALVPPNSRVLSMGLVDGSVIYDTVANVSHPLSIHTGDITVADFYRFLSCTGANPCPTWLTDNTKMRDAATAHAYKLSDAMADVVATKQFKNLKAAYVDFRDIIKCGYDLMDASGIPHHKMMDPVDNFHPSLSVGHPLIAQCAWKIMNTNYPGFLGEPNPHNEAIEKKFGKQGGY